MERIKVAENFYLDEFIPRHLYVRYHHKPHILLNLILPEVFEIAQKLRDKYGPMYINDWWGMDARMFYVAMKAKTVRNWSGLRTPFWTDFDKIHSWKNFIIYHNKYYSEAASHSRGSVFDAKFKDHQNTDHIVEDLRLNHKVYGITELETGTGTWVHTGIRLNYEDEDSLYIYAKKSKK